MTPSQVIVLLRTVVELCLEQKVLLLDGLD